MISRAVLWKIKNKLKRFIIALAEYSENETKSKKIMLWFWGVLILLLGVCRYCMYFSVTKRPEKQRNFQAEKHEKTALQSGFLIIMRFYVLVETKRIELSTLRMRTVRSPS